MGQLIIKQNLDGINGLCLMEPTVHGDDRGYFMEVFNQKDMEEAGLKYAFVQANQSRSAKGVLRGLHFQKRFPQAKLIRVIRGTVFDVAVDLRADSPTCGKYHGELLSEDNRKQHLIPRGFAHGFLVLSDMAELCYLCDALYCPEDEGGLAWNDPEIGIVWPEVQGVYPGSAEAGGYTLTDGLPLRLSERDQRWPCLRDAFRFRGIC